MDEAEGVGVVGVNLERLFGKQVFETGTAPGLGAGVVGFETTASGEPEREVIADHFGGVTVTDDLEEAFHAVLELSLVKARGAGVFLVGNGPVILAFVDAVPVETGVDRAELAELVEDFFGRLVFEAGRAHALGNFADDPPVGLGFAPGLDGFAESLDTTLGVGLDTVGFAPRGGGQDDVGKLAGLGQENVDDNEVIETLESVLAVVLVRVCHDSVFPVDEHSVNALTGFVERGDLGDAAFGVNRIASVKLGELSGIVRIVAGLEAGEVGGNGTAVAGALDVVLTAHRIDAATFETEVAGHEGEVAE